MDCKYIIDQYKRYSMVQKQRAIKFLAKYYDSGKIYALMYWRKEEKIVVLNEYGHLYQFENRALRRFNCNLGSIFNKAEFGVVHNLFAFGAILFVVFLDTAACRIAVVKKTEVCKVELFSLIGLPTCILLHGNVLFVGTSLGELYIYYCSELDYIDFNQYQHKLELKCGSIKKIDVIEEDVLHLSVTGDDTTNVNMCISDQHLSVEQQLDVENKRNIISCK